MILSAQTLRRVQPVAPFVERSVQSGMSYGLSGAGYDIRIKDDTVLHPRDFGLRETVEIFYMPDDVLGFVKDKSTWARQGLSVFNTIIEPGWKGVLTIELKNMGNTVLFMRAGDPIAQVIFCRLDDTTEQPYSGKYQNAQGLQSARYEEKE